MEPSGRHNFFIPSSFSSPSAKSNTNKKSNAKSQRSLFSHDSSIEKNQLQSNVKKMMTSDPYNRIFNKLMNIGELKEFVKQSSQYVEFHQAQVKKFIPPAHSQRFRFSFSLKSPNSVCSFLAKDYRFLKRYHELLEIQFPEKKDQFKQDIYQTYKDQVLDRKKFDEYFGPSHLKSIKGKEKSLLKSSFKSKKEKKHQNPAKSVQSEKKHVSQKSSILPFPQLKNKTPSKYKIQNKSKQKKSQKTQKPDEIDIKKSELQQQVVPAKSSKKWNPNQKRTTQQNLKLIEETLVQIQHIKASSPSLGGSKIQVDENLNPNPKKEIASLSKKKVVSSKKTDPESKKKILSEKKLIQKVEKESKNRKTIGGQIKKDRSQIVQEEEKKQKQAESFDEEAMYERMIARRMSNKPKKLMNETEEQREQRLLGIQPTNSKVKSKKKEEHKTVKFSDLIDINDPKYKEFLEKFDKMEAEKEKQKEKQKQKKEKQEEFMKRVTIRIAEMKREVRHTFGQKEKNALTLEEREIVNLFPSIKSIGGWKHYTFDRAHSSFEELGECFGYKVEKIGCWPTEDSDVDEVYFCLYLKKLESSNEENPSKTEKNPEELEELKRKIQKFPIDAITILFIEN